MFNNAPTHERQLLYHLQKLLARLELRNLVGGDDHGGVLGDIASELLLALYDTEGAEATEVHILTVCHIALDALHNLLDDGGHGHLLNAGLLGNLGNDFSFSHNCICLCVCCLLLLFKIINSLYLSRFQYV